jgi:Protein of unknown function (DUF3611)
MSKNTDSTWEPKDPEKLAKHFRRLGWIGFWVQLILLSLPVFLLFYVLFIKSPESVVSKGIDLSVYLSNGSLLVMLFTTFWFYRYTKLAPKIASPELRPSQNSVEKTIWVGLWASVVGVFFSMMLMISAVTRLLFVLLATPQTGIPVTTTGGYPGHTLSAIDAVSLTSLLFSLCAELTVLLFSIWLLFKTTRVTVPEPVPEPEQL